MGFPLKLMQMLPSLKRGLGGTKNFLSTNFSPESLKLQHLAPFKDPKGAVHNFLGLPTHTSANYYKHLKKGPLKDWAQKMEKIDRDKAIINAPDVNNFSKALKNRDALSALKSGGKLVKNNPLSAAFSALTLSSLPGLVIDPLKAVGKGEKGIAEGIGDAAGGLYGYGVAGPLAGSIGSFMVRDPLINKAGKTIDKILDTAPRAPQMNPVRSMPNYSNYNSDYFGA